MVNKLLNNLNDDKQIHLFCRFLIEKFIKVPKVFKPTNNITCNLLYVCLFVPKDVANLWTNMVLLYNVASHRFWESLTVLKGGTKTQENLTLEKSDPFLKEIEMLGFGRGGGGTYPSHTSNAPIETCVLSCTFN